jgi:hypothetical protein
VRIQWLNGMPVLAAAAFLLSPAAGQAQTQIREGVYRYGPSTYSTVVEYPTLPPGRRGLGIGENPQPPYAPPSYYQYPTYFNRPTYMTSINYPYMYGGHFYMTDGALCSSPSPRTISTITRATTQTRPCRPPAPCAASAASTAFRQR